MHNVQFTMTIDELASNLFCTMVNLMMFIELFCSMTNCRMCRRMVMEHWPNANEKRCSKQKGICSARIACKVRCQIRSFYFTAQITSHKPLLAEISNINIFHITQYFLEISYTRNQWNLLNISAYISGIFDDFFKAGLVPLKHDTLCCLPVNRTGTSAGYTGLLQPTVPPIFAAIPCLTSSQGLLMGWHVSTLRFLKPRRLKAWSWRTGWPLRGGLSQHSYR